MLVQYDTMMHFLQKPRAKKKFDAVEPQQFRDGHVGKAGHNRGCGTDEARMTLVVSANLLGQSA